MNKKVVITTLGIAAFSSSFFSSAFAEPVTGNTEFSVTVNPYLNVTLSSNDVHLSVTPSSGGTFGSTSFTATSSTNNALGYSLNLAIKDTNTSQAVLTTNLTSDTINVNDGTKPTIPTFSTNDVLTSEQFSASTSSDHLNHWAMSLNDTSHYQKVSSESTINQSDVPIADDVTTLNLATKLNLLTTPGLYSAYFNFEIVANVPPVSLAQAYHDANKTKTTINGQEYYSIQDMNSGICSATTEIPSELQVFDARDNNIYWIAKLADGHCWMTQNLDLDLSNQTALVHATSDIGWGTDTTTMSWTPERSTIVVTSTTTSSWVDDVYNPYSADVGARYFTDTWYNDVCNTREGCNYINNTANGKFSNSPHPGNGEHGRVGNYYNWTAAIASNDSTNMVQHEMVAQNSVCPAGWRLPTAYTLGSEKNNEFENLVSKYTTDYTSDRGVLSAPLYFTRAGNFYERILSWAGNGGSYWSSVADNDQTEKFAQYMNFRHDLIAPTYSHERIVGWNIRCIAR